MQWKDLYTFALFMVLVGMIVGVGVITLYKFGGAAGITSTASTAINAGAAAVAGIANTWMALIITIGVLAIILSLVIGGFAIGGRGR